MLKEDLDRIGTRRERLTFYALKVKMVEKRIAELEESIPKESSFPKKMSMQNTLKTNREVLKLVTNCFQAAIEENKA